MVTSAVGVEPFLVRDAQGVRAPAPSIAARVARLWTPEVGRLAATGHSDSATAAIPFPLSGGGGDVVSLWPPVIGEAEARSKDFAQCARLASNAELQRIGVGRDDFSPDNSTAYDTQAAVLRLNVAGLHAEVWGGDPMLLAARMIPQGKYLMVGVNCTPNCTPVTYDSGIRHWLATYSTAGDSYNCWFAQLARYDNLSACHNYLMGTLVLWRDGVVPVDNPQQPPPSVPVTFVEENVMVFRFLGSRFTIYIGGDGKLRRRRQTYGQSGWRSKVIDSARTYKVIDGADVDATSIHISATDTQSGSYNIYSADGDRWATEGPIEDDGK